MTAFIPRIWKSLLSQRPQEEGLWRQHLLPSGGHKSHLILGASPPPPGSTPGSEDTVDSPLA